MKPTVGLIGLGLMGGPMGLNLLKAGFPLIVWNRTKSKAEELVAAGAKLAADPRSVAEQADVLITIVSDPPALEEVLFGAQGAGANSGALATMRPGSTLIDSSTVSPDLARRVAAACAERGVDFLDAPVTGGTWGAKKGELVFMVGGKAEVLEHVKPVLEAMGKKFPLLGPNGAGQTVKLGMNLLLALQVDAFAESLALVTLRGRAGGQADGSAAIEHGAFGCAGCESADDGEGRISSELSAAADAQGRAARAGAGARARSEAAVRRGRVRDLFRGDGFI